MSTPLRISPSKVYLDRSGHRVGIRHDRGHGQAWRWLTTKGYYVREDGKAAWVGTSSKDLVVEIVSDSQGTKSHF